LRLLVLGGQKIDTPPKVRYGLAVTGTIDLQRLQLICDLPASLVNSWGDAAAVMLDKFHEPPPPPTTIAVEHDGARASMMLSWQGPCSQLRAGHANEKDATEDGAYAIAIAAANHRGYRVRRRAHQGSGADLLMTRHGEPQNDFVKLEVSGVARGNGVARRLAEKLEQVRGGDLQRPGVAVVVGFEAAMVLMRSAP
jgi:hypothetical protein